MVLDALTVKHFSNYQKKKNCVARKGLQGRTGLESTCEQTTEDVLSVCHNLQRLSALVRPAFFFSPEIKSSSFC